MRSVMPVCRFSEDSGGRGGESHGSVAMPAPFSLVYRIRPPVLFEPCVGRLAQWPERQLYTLDVGGSSPSPPTDVSPYDPSPRAGHRDPSASRRVTHIHRGGAEGAEIRVGRSSTSRRVTLRADVHEREESGGVGRSSTSRRVTRDSRAGRRREGTGVGRSSTSRRVTLEIQAADDIGFHTCRSIIHKPAGDTYRLIATCETPTPVSVDHPQAGG